MDAQAAARRKVAWWPLGISSALLLFLTPLYIFRPDWAAAATILPAFFWLFVGLTLAIAGFRLGRWSLAALTAWLLFALLYVEELRSTVRPGFRINGAGRAPGTDFRVISLNCLGGDPEAAAEVVGYAPDIVLYQETPSATDLQELKDSRLDQQWSVVPGLDGSILARGSLTPIKLPPYTGDFTMADGIVKGRRLQVVSLRLVPPVGRVDLWNPNCWTEQRRNREIRRKELASIVSFIGSQRIDAPLIIGGDFNAVAGDASLQAMGFLTDSFNAAGRGWCDTAVNDFPFARIDRIYVSDDLEVLASTVRKTKNSDHRMLIVDLRFRQPK
jgi:vancomycin resistance protein VanJ